MDLNNDEWLKIITGVLVAGTSAIAFLFKLQHSRSEKIESLFHEQQGKLVELSYEVGELRGKSKGSEELAKQLAEQLVDQVVNKIG